MNRRARSVEIFSMSALDLFASAMGAFVLLAVMMLPYYHKGKEMEEEIGRLEPQVEASEARAVAAGAGLAELRSQLSTIESAAAADPRESEQRLAEARARARALEAELRATAEEIEAKRQAAKAPAPGVATPATQKVTFRFAGLKTDVKRYLLLVDGAGRVKTEAPNLPQILKSAVEVMGPQKEFAIAFYSFADGRLVYNRWPASGFSTGGPGAQGQALNFLRQAYVRMGGGSATSQALAQALSERPEAIILISDGIVYPPHNENRNWQQVVEATTLANREGVQINVVAIGLFSRNESFWTFLNNLRRRNGGDLKAIPP